MAALPADGAVGLTAFAVARRSGPAADHHDRPVDGAGRLVELLEVDGPALVLGSTQVADVVDVDSLAGAATSLVRRRSGGGAVLLEPGAAVWIDVTIGRDDPLWDDDVGRASHWLGRAWAAALGGEVHTGGLVEARWSRLVCFAGLGPGEVVVGGRKLVGISQRRTRAAARFQCLVHRHWAPEHLVPLLALDETEAAALLGDLDDAVASVDLTSEDVLDALLTSLPR